MDQKLTYLLKLLDDDSPEVKSAILKEILAYGPALEYHLSQLGAAVSEEQRTLLKDLLGEHARVSIKSRWRECFKEKSEVAQIENALQLIAEFQNGPNYPYRLKKMLDELTKEFEQHIFQDIDPVKLADFIFKTKHFRGVNGLDYYNPSNSNLVYCLENRCGIPISLSLIFILVGARLGMEIEGCNFPGHFLARFYADEKMILVDGYNSGRFLDEESIFEMNPNLPEVVREVLKERATSCQIIMRVLHNLIKAYEETKQKDNSELMVELLEETEAIARENLEDPPSF